MATDADRYIWLIANLGLIDEHVSKWDVRRHKPMLRYLQDFIDKGVYEDGPRFIKAQRELLR